MQFSTIQATLLALITFPLIHASPASLVPISSVATLAPQNFAHHPLLKRKEGNIGGLYMCNNPDFTAPCTYFLVPQMYTCWNLKSEWTNSLSSFGPDRAFDDKWDFACSLYAENNCAGKSFTVVYPGFRKLKTDPGMDMEDQGKSLDCHWLHPENFKKGSS